MVECRTCLGAKGETDTLAASMNDSEEVLIASSEDPASRIILVDNIPFRLSVAGREF
jgi:hypothetical protein